MVCYRPTLCIVFFSLFLSSWRLNVFTLIFLVIAISKELIEYISRGYEVLCLHLLLYLHMVMDNQNVKEARAQVLQTEKPMSTAIAV